MGHLTPSSSGDKNRLVHGAPWSKLSRGLGAGAGARSLTSVLLDTERLAIASAAASTLLIFYLKIGAVYFESDVTVFLTCAGDNDLFHLHGGHFLKYLPVPVMTPILLALYILVV